LEWGERTKANIYLARRKRDLWTSERLLGELKIFEVISERLEDDERDW
jgi:hypothetical protein